MAHAPRKKRRPLKKRLLASPPVIWIIAMLFTAIVRFLYLTQRVEKRMPASVESILGGSEPAIMCFWHGRMILQPFMNPPRPMYVLSSQHSDGKLISTVMRFFGIRTVYGSTSRGAAKAVRMLRDIVRTGGNISITPDGPRGPFQQAMAGPAYIASKTGCRLLPITFSSTRHWRFTSWDRFMLPKPFGRSIFVVGEPITVEADASSDALRDATKMLEAELNRITAEADAACGVTA